ncbi:Esterase FE4, partial [Frankliniella fusca]
MVYVHGGGFLTGSGWMYGPEFLLDRDVVLVSFNYRLGALGFLSTGDDVIPGNFGMKDQVQLLRWVRDNIAAFGGDPDQVTIFGESAGGASVHALTLSPLAK